MDFEFEIEGKKYAVGPLTLGTARMVAREFGVHDIKAFDWSNPDYLAAIVYLGLSADDPSKSHADLMEQVDALDLSSLVDSITSAVLAAIEKAREEGQPDPSPAPKPRPRKRTASAGAAGK